MQNNQIFYLKIISLSVVISAFICFALGSVLFAKSNSLIKVEERLSRMELKAKLETIISPYSDCNESLRGLKTSKTNEFTNMEVLAYKNGEIAFKSNERSGGLYIEQMRLKTLKSNFSDNKASVELHMPLRSNRDRSIKLSPLKVSLKVNLDNQGRILGCRK